MSLTFIFITPFYKLENMSKVKTGKKDSTHNPLGKYFGYFNTLLDTKLAKSLKLRELTEKIVYQGTYNAIKIANARVFKGSGKKKGERLQAKPATDLFNLNYTEEQLMIKESLVQLANKMRIAAEHIDEEYQINQELWDEFNALELTYMLVPESLGGVMQEKSTVTQMLMAETLAYGDVGQALAFLSRHSVVNAIVQWGNEAQQTELIPEFLSGQPPMVSTAVNEPVALFNPYQLSTKAEIAGDKIVLNGRKNMVPLAEASAYFLVAADLQGKGPQIFIVDNHLKGMQVSEQKGMGLNAAQLGEIVFNNVEIDISAQLGGEAGVNYEEFIHLSKLGWCALAVGGCQAVLDYVIPYCNDRYAFGEPISNRQAVAFMNADMKIETDGMRLLTQRAVSRAEQGLDFGREAYLAHVFCSDKSMKIGTDGVQLLGGHGYIRDYPVQRWYRDLRAVAISYNGIHL